MRHRGTSLYRRASSNRALVRLMTQTVAILRGSILAQVALLAALPLLSRLYSPEAFGALAFYQNVVGVTAILATLRLELRIPRARSLHQAREIALTCIFTSMTIAAILIPTCFLFAQLSQSDPHIARYWYVVPAGTAALGTFTAVNMWLAYCQRYKLLGRIRIAQAAQSLLIQLCYPLLFVGSLGLLIGGVIGQGLGVIGIAWRLHRRANLFCLDRPRKMLRASAGFIVRALPVGLIGRSAVHIPMPLFVAFYGAEHTGLVFLAYRIVSSPSALLGRATALPVQQFVGKNDSAASRKVLIAIVVAYFCLGAVGSVAVFLGGEFAFPLIFGREWAVAGEFAAVLSPLIAFQFAAGPFAQILTIHERFGSQILLESIRLALLLLAIGLPGFLGLDIYVAVTAFSFVMCLVYASYPITALMIKRRKST